MEKHAISSDPGAARRWGPIPRRYVAATCCSFPARWASIRTTGKLVEGGVEAQARQVFKNLAAVLAAAGINSRRLLKTTVFLKDMAHFKAVNEIYAAEVPPPYPARAAVAVAELPLGAAVEIEAIAAMAD